MCVIPTPIIALSPKSLFGVWILCPKRSRNPDAAGEEKTGFGRIPINT
jgi:hypothetical protein